MIRGLSGTLLSAEALLDAGFGSAGGEVPWRAQRALQKWYARIERSAGPAWSSRKVFDEIGVPFCLELGLRVVPGASDSHTTRGLLTAGDRPIAVIVSVAWGEAVASTWRPAVLSGIAAGVRWCLCFNGPGLRIFDASRTHSRRCIELDLLHAACDPVTFSLTWRLLNASAFPVRGPSTLEAAIHASETYRVGVRDSLQAGVHEALRRLTTAFLEAGRRRRHRRGKPMAIEAASDESLVVIYRILFLLFAEARGLVPNWHPVFRESYTVESVRPAVENLHSQGLWETLQAIARLAHRGCQAGSLRVPPFNGRLFSPAHAPFADMLPLDDRHVRDAVLALTTRQDGGVRRRIAYGDLGVEHLGGVYERVLDFDVAATASAGPAVLVRGGRRKATGTFYTPRTLTEYLVRRTLAPLVRNVSPDNILRLRIVDPAMGSGAFLVAACRYLARAYEEALVRDGVAAPFDITEGERAGFRRSVAQRCLYGVDVNPMAVQLARLSLWLATLCSDRPLTFFDDQLRVGNSVVGAAVADVTRSVSRSRARSAPLPLFDTSELDLAMDDAVRSHVALSEGPEETLEHIKAKERLFEALTAPDARLARWKRVVDLWCARWFGHEAGPVGGNVFRTLLDGTTLPATIQEPLLQSASDVAAGERFFHWPLEFPEIFAGASGSPTRDGGFDAVVGNPPWEMLRGDVYAEHGNRLTRFARESGVYTLQGDGHANLFQLFLERAFTIVRSGGRIGLVLPSGFASDHGCARLRRHLLDRSTVDGIVAVDNIEAVFPIHRGLRFLLITTTMGAGTCAVPLRSGIRSASEFDRLNESGVDPEAVPLPRELLERMSGDQLVIPDIRAPVDAAIAARLTCAHRPAADEEGWGLRFGRELNATDDRRHFAPPGAGLLPVLEGKHLQPFEVDIAGSRRAIEASVASTLLPTFSFTRSRLAYRDVAASSNRLTLIAAVLPGGVVTTHTIFCLKTLLDDDAQHFLCGIFNSFVANYLVRMRVTTHVTVSIIERLPVPRPARDDERFAEMAALARRLAVHSSDERAAARHQALAAGLYGLDARELSRVLETFPLIDRAVRDRTMDAFIRTL